MILKLLWLLVYLMLSSILLGGYDEFVGVKIRGNNIAVFGHKLLWAFYGGGICALVFWIQK